MIIRATNEHRAFVLSTWIRSKWDLVRDLYNHDTYIRNEPRLAELRFKSADVWIYTPDGYSIDGWVCGKKSANANGLTGEDGYKALLFHVYVAPELRGHGLATRLIEHCCEKQHPEVIVCVDEIRKLKNLPPSRLPIGQWNPYRMSEV